MSNLSEIFQLSPAGVMQRADEMRPFIERLASKFPEGTFTFYGVLAKFIKVEWTCLIREDEYGNIGTLGATASYPDMNNDPTVQIMFIVGGSLVQAEECHIMIEKYCRDHGIKTIEFYGREGWKPMMDRLGYDSSQRIYIKRL